MAPAHQHRPPTQPPHKQQQVAQLPGPQRQLRRLQPQPPQQQRARQQPPAPLLLHVQPPPPPQGLRALAAVNQQLQRVPPVAVLLRLLMVPLLLLVQQGLGMQLALLLLLPRRWKALPRPPRWCLVRLVRGASLAPSRPWL